MCKALLREATGPCSKGRVSAGAVALVPRGQGEDPDWPSLWTTRLQLSSRLEDDLSNRWIPGPRCRMENWAVLDLLPLLILKA